jgi:hypothetical protein
MKLITFIALVTSLCPLFAADDFKKPADPFAEAFFPPELVLMARDRIALTQEQQDAFRARVQARADHARRAAESAPKEVLYQTRCRHRCVSSIPRTGRG